MKSLLSFLGWPFGLRFAEDNHVVPVLRWGRYHRTGGPGYFWIVPLFEKTLPPVKTSLHVGNFVFDEVLSKDGIPIRINMTILFAFEPAKAFHNAAAVLVRGGTDLFQIIVKDYANQGLRRLAAKFDAETLWGEAAAQVERDLARFLTAELHPLGIAPLRSGGILIKEMQLPAKLKQTILRARQLRLTLEALAPFPIPGLIEQAIQAVFTTNLEDNDLTLLMSANVQNKPSEPSYVFDIQNLLNQRT